MITGKFHDVKGGQETTTQMNLVKRPHNVNIRANLTVSLCVILVCQIVHPLPSITGYYQSNPTIIAVEFIHWWWAQG